MKRLNSMLRAVLAAVWVGWTVCLWMLIQQKTAAPAVGPQSYSAFTVELDGERIVIRNAGGEVLTDCEIEFTAGLDVPGEATYHGRRSFVRWEPGEVQEIGIVTPKGPTDVRSVQFSGRASSPGKTWGIWRLAYQPGPEGR